MSTDGSGGGMLSRSAMLLHLVFEAKPMPFRFRVASRRSDHASYVKDVGLVAVISVHHEALQAPLSTRHAGATVFPETPECSSREMWAFSARMAVIRHGGP
jgi:hypothetical protein